MADEPQCKVCDLGVLRKRTKYKLGSVVALIGYIILIPSLLGMFGGCSLMFGSSKMAADIPSKPTMAASVEKGLVDDGVPPATIAAIKDGQPLGAINLTGLDEKQQNTAKAAISYMQARKDGAEVGKVVAGVAGTGFGFLLAVSSFVGGLLGWLLIGKKKILQCTNCGAAIGAS